MIAGLVTNAGPTLNVPVPDSKDRNSETRGNKFSDVLDSKTGLAPKKDDVVKAEPDKSKLISSDSLVEKKVTESKGRVESQEDSESQPEGPPDPKVMDPRTSALRAQRDRAIRKFMDSFESEFGIPPEEMVEAMSQLTTQDLEKPPEKTVDTLIAKLELAPQDELKARKMYMGLILQLKQIDTNVTMPRAQDDLLSQLSAQRVKLSADQKSVMTAQAQGLSDKFWMRGASQEKAITPEMNQLQVREFMKKMITAESAGIGEHVELEPEVAASTENLLKRLKSESPEAEEQPEQVLLDHKETISFMPEGLARKPSAEDANQQGAEENSEQEPFFKGATISKEAVQAEFKRIGIKPVEHLQTKKIEKADVEATLNPDVSSLSQGNYENMKSILPSASILPTVEMNPVQKTENMQQIMNQAQILLKNGGGEVKVEMTPEGMGSIQMKLQVLDGKVQLHMNTETKEAKKLIESSINDLKQSLAAHQLSMDLMKVDVVHQSSSSHGAHNNAQNDMQNQMQNFLNQQQRDGTKQFWQQFNDSFGNRQARDNFFDAQNIKGPVKDQLLPSLESRSSNGRARSDGRGKSLNVVA